MHQIVDLIINRVVNNCLSLIIFILLRTKHLVYFLSSIIESNVEHEVFVVVVVF